MAASREEVFERVKDVLTEQLGIEIPWEAYPGNYTLVLRNSSSPFESVQAIVRQGPLFFEAPTVALWEYARKDLLGMMEVSYESLVEKPETVLRVVCAFVGIRKGAAHGIAVNTGTSLKVQYAYSFAPSGTTNHSRPTELHYPNGRAPTTTGRPAGWMTGSARSTDFKSGSFAVDRAYWRF